MDGLNKEQLEFVNNYYRIVGNKEISVKNVVVSLFHIYLVAKTESEKESAAMLIAKLKPEIKKAITFWHLIDINLLNERVARRSGKVREATLSMQERRHQKRKDFSLDFDEWEDTLNHFDYKCAYCLEDKKITYDHFIPFIKKGPFTKENILPACKSCNSSKHKNNFGDWYKKQPFYNESQEKKILEFIKINQSVVRV